MGAPGERCLPSYPALHDFQDLNSAFYAYTAGALAAEPSLQPNELNFDVIALSCLKCNFKKRLERSLKSIGTQGHI